MGRSSPIPRVGCRVISDPGALRPAGLLLLLALATPACGGEPDGGLVEVHAALDPAVADEVGSSRVYRVLIQGGAESAVREIEQRGAPPDVFVVRSPVTVPPADDAFSISVRVQALSFMIGGGEVIAGCAEQGDVAIIEGAVNILELTLMPGDCP